MITLVAVLLLIESIVFPTFSYVSFDEENKKCDIKGDWSLVRYEDKTLVLSALNKSLTVLRARNECCASIPIILKPESALEIVVYVTTTEVNSGLAIAVYLDKHGVIAECILIRADESFENGWRKISLHIDKGGIGHINLFGYSKDNEMVLIYYVRHELNTATIDVITDKDIISKEKNEYVNKKETIGSREIKGNRNSKIEKPNDETGIEDLKRFRNTNDSRGLGPWAITLISLGCVTVAALVGVSAYYLGKFKATPKYPAVIFDEEPTQVKIIPRVRGTVNYFEDTIQNYL